MVAELDAVHQRVSRLIIVAPTQEPTLPELWEPYRESSSIDVLSYRHNEDDGLKQRRLRLKDILPIVKHLRTVARECDLVQVRAPGNVALVSALFLPFVTKRLICKYAGEWPLSWRDPLTIMVQKLILRSPLWRKHLVFVYGQWPRQPKQVRSTFASILNDTSYPDRPKTDAGGSTRITYVGRLSSNKNVHVLLAALAGLTNERWKLTLVGSGDQLNPLRKQCTELGVADRVHFTGPISHADVLKELSRTDIFVLVSDTEGWPKALTEAMACGAACIGSRVGAIPQILADGRGVVVARRDLKGLQEALQALLRSPELRSQIGKKAQSWSQSRTLRDAIDGVASNIQAHFTFEAPTNLRARR